MPELAPQGTLASIGAPIAKAHLEKLDSQEVSAAIISVLAKRMKNLLVQNGIGANDHFYGVNEFTDTQNFGQMMQRWLASIKRSGKTALIMCHPGRASARSDDPIASRRPDELAYLLSEQFQQDMAVQSLTLG